MDQLLQTANLLKPPEDFPFPFEPYDVQKQFMKNLYQVLEEGKLGIFESPTGTGKSLSIICGALCWLRDHESRELQVLQTNIQLLNEEKETAEKDLDWVKGQALIREIEHRRRILELKLEQIKQQERKIEEMRKNVKQKKKNAEKTRDLKKNVPDPNINHDVTEDDDILLEEVDDLKDDLENCEEVPEEDQHHFVKIIVCSRTHTQLAQFVNEVKRSPFSDMRLIPLASRQNYCINPAVKKLKSLMLINERCTDMQRGSKGNKTEVQEGKTVKKSCTSAGCPYLKAQQAVNELTEQAVVTVQDVESLVTVGQKLGACPYYASRNALSDTQIVVIPYNTLLHQRTRKACGLQIKGNVVIIDEAHNLLDTIAQVHSAQVTGQQLTHVHSQLTQYRNRYHKRFSATNLLYLEQLIFVISNLIRMLGAKPGSKNKENIKTEETTLHSLSEFVLSAKIDNINLFHLLAFCTKSKLSHKLHGFTERHQPSVQTNSDKKTQSNSGVQAFLNKIANKNNQPEKVEPNAQVVTSNSPVLPTLAFLEALTNHSDDGRVVCCRKATVGQGVLKYLLLNPARHFADIVQQARSVVVAGGTMQPTSEFRELLFFSAGAPLTRVLEYTCGHVIPPDHILPIALTHGPTNKLLDFSFQTRNSPDMLNEIGRVLVNLCSIVPAGIVCFFCSYEYEQLVHDFLEKSGIIAKLATKKQLFREPRQAGQVDKVLKAFAAAINATKERHIRPNGALMFSVVGGKLSEGLNFCDDLGRCVVVVGMPYPNIKCPELQEKISYLNTHVNKNAGRQHYENLCMRAVNQAIGRAVRHKGDYATMVLLDHRYAKLMTQKLLPQWIRDSLKTHDNMGSAIGQISKFFAAKRKH